MGHFFHFVYQAEFCKSVNKIISTTFASKFPARLKHTFVFLFNFTLTKVVVFH